MVRLEKTARHWIAASCRDKRSLKKLWTAILTEITRRIEGQKVMIAMAVANQPRLLIADEPTNSLESIARSQASPAFQHESKPRHLYLTRR